MRMIFVSPYLKPSCWMLFLMSGRSSVKSELIRMFPCGVLIRYTARSAVPTQYKFPAILNPGIGVCQSDCARSGAADTINRNAIRLMIFILHTLSGRFHESDLERRHSRREQ